MHGLTRQGRDFDVLAQALCAHAQQRGEPLCVVCPDVVGRGRSDWLQDPQDYQLPTYVTDMLALIQALAPQRLDWLGTSMGGLIGMALASLPDGVRPAALRSLILNDVGPALQWSALVRIGQYLGRTGAFDDETQAAQALWAVSSSFGPHTPEQWLALTRPMLKPLGDGTGRLTLHYDPALAQPFKALTPEAAQAAEALMWQAYDHIVVPTLLVRGAESDLLSTTTAQQMTQRGPRAQLIEFAGVGHAPTFVVPEQIRPVRDFLWQ
ncbi:MAG: hypothetical protein Fur007_01480 [Rhodoferax sp.]